MTDPIPPRIEFDSVETPWFLKKGPLLTAAGTFIAAAVLIIAWRHSRDHGPQAPDLPLVSVHVPGRSSYDLTDRKSVV